MQSGFTLMELMTVILIMTVTMSVAVPQLLSLNASVERMNTKLMVLQDLRRAQSEAITQGCRGILKIASDSKSYTYGCDYLNYSTATPPVADNQIFIRYLPNLFTIATSGTVIFNSRGQSVDQSDILSTRTITLREASSGSPTVFATGSLNAIGMFDYN